MLAVVAVGVAATACGQDAGTAGTAPTRKGDGRSLHRCVGQRGQRGRRRPCDRQLPRSRAPSTIHTRLRPARPTRPPSPTRRWWSTTAAATTTGSTMCWPTIPMSRPSTPTRCCSSAEQPANEHVFYDMGTAKAVADHDRRPTGPGRRRPRVGLPRQRRRVRQASRHHRSSRSGRSPRRTPGQRSSRPNPSPITCWSTRASPIQPRRASPALSKRTPIRHRPTSRRCSI